MLRTPYAGDALHRPALHLESTCVRSPCLCHPYNIVLYRYLSRRPASPAHFPSRRLFFSFSFSFPSPPAPSAPREHHVSLIDDSTPSRHSTTSDAAASPIPISLNSNSGVFTQSITLHCFPRLFYFYKPPFLYVMSSKDGLDSELESFRRQWLSDLKSQKEPQPTTSSAAAAASSASSGPSHRRRQSHSQRHHVPLQGAPPSASRPGPLKKPNGPSSPTAARRALILDEGSDYLEGRSFDEPAPPVVSSTEPRTLASSIDDAAKPREKKLVTALDHFEEAMEKEAQGNMGESLRLYRKAYKVTTYRPLSALLNIYSSRIGYRWTMV